RAHIAELEVSERISTDVREGLEKSQREFLLRQQLAAIRKELGEGEPDGATDYRARVEQADLPEQVRKAALREADRWERSSDASPEAGWIRTWLDTVLDLPWHKRTEDSTDLTAARAALAAGQAGPAAARAGLGADHAGVADVKDRIMEYLAVRNRRASRGLHVVGGRGSGAVLGLVGHPGVDKTSVCESVSRALGRKFVRVSLGGVRDEAEIRGHRRTYVGALPGRIIQNLRRVGTRNPVFVLDEVDKVGTDFRGDPSSALLEVLDPEQNATFSDHYLEVPFDLSQVLFIATANLMDPVPPALRDRMEVIELPGYTAEEKLEIAKRFLVPRQLEQNGVADAGVELPDETLRAVIGSYTREAGVRNLEGEIGGIARKLA